LGFTGSRAVRLEVVALLIALLAAASNTWAQPASELERGRSLFRTALSMEVAGDWAGALSRLEQVSRIKTTPQVRFHLARCKEHLGRQTEALGDYRLAEYEALQLNAAEIGEIRQARQELETRVPRLIVTLNPELADATVELDGIALGESRLGKEIPVDPGDHQLVVRTVDGQSFVRRTRVAESTIEPVHIDPPAGFVLGSSRGKNSAFPNARPNSLDSNPGGHPPSWVWIAGGVGVAGAITAGVLWYVRERAIDDLNNGCKGDICPTRLSSTQTRGEQASVGAPIALGIGLLGLGIATYGFLSPEHKTIAVDSRPALKLRLNVGCDAHFAGANVAASF
jgi:hypothetical protein